MICDYHNNLTVLEAEVDDNPLARIRLVSVVDCVCNSLTNCHPDLVGQVDAKIEPPKPADEPVKTAEPGSPPPDKEQAGKRA